MKKLACVFLSVLPLVSSFNVSAQEQPRTDVPNRCFYKDIFFDCGIGLTTMDSLPVASKLNLSIEKMGYNSREESKLQNEILSGSLDDWNGHLLWPDGSPRFKVLILDGGNSQTHGSSIGEDGRRRMREFYENGGSYVGSCAGSIITCEGFEGQACPYYLKIWPNKFRHTGKDQTRTGMIIENNSPLLKYTDFGGALYVSGVRHNQGNFPDIIPEGGEVLARFDIPTAKKMHNQPSIVAYKKNTNTGRLVLTGSHPEEVTEGEILDLYSAMVQYAIDGVGMTKIKGFLENGVERNMNKYTYEQDPAFTRIGDQQCHHFAVNLPEGARNVTFTLEGAEGSHMTLAICKDTYAYEDCADIIANHEGAFQTFTLPKPKAGLWYVCVKCLDSVEAYLQGPAHFYKKTAIEDLLNGVPYTVKVSWE
ncbi:MAG: hypothetical protein MJZ74_04560 [Muribaculaceae bacterium]|nr:hypothetical protein [Muribaculaceae bacterium]